MKKLLRFFRDEEGISSVEYAILLAFIAAALVAAVIALRDAVIGRFEDATEQLQPQQGG